MLFLENEISQSKFNAMALDIEVNVRHTGEDYQKLLAKNPNSHAILLGYARFLDICMNDPVEAEKSYLKSEQLRAIEDQSNNEGGVSGNQGAFTIQEDGLIESVNNVACKQFGYNKSELIGRNINVIVPPPWKDLHNMFIQQFKTGNGQSKFMNVSRRLYGHHKQGHAFEILFELKESRDQDRKRKFIGLISEVTPTDEGVKIISDSTGTIIMVSGSIQKVFGYQERDVNGKNVSMLMPDSHAKAHSSYVSKYLETGIGKVIGRQGRNLTGKGKGGKTFPITINVEKMELQKEIYFVATMWDTTELVGTIFINGLGLIKTADDNFCNIYGYKREDIINKNINIIMPAPVAGLHRLLLTQTRQSRFLYLCVSEHG